ncbi:MAG TPA: hypothetical protein ENH30_08325 [Nitrospirae bacterium]|nr:hypothetical protein [Nitrospirota bacterium]
MYECVSCRRIWYEERTHTDDCLAVMDEITGGIEKNGYCEIPFTTLRDTVFVQEEDRDWHAKKEILKWAVRNRLLYKYDKRKNGTIVRFYRDRKYSESNNQSLR